MRLNCSIVLTALVLVGCSGPTIHFGQQDFKIAVYNGGRIDVEGSLSQSAQAVIELKKVVTNPNAHWDFSLVTYAPAVAFYNPDIMVFLQRREVIINTNDGKGTFTEWVSTLDPAEFEKIRQMTEMNLAMSRAANSTARQHLVAP